MAYSNQTYCRKWGVAIATVGMPHYFITLTLQGTVAIFVLIWVIYVERQKEKMSEPVYGPFENWARMKVMNSFDEANVFIAFILSDATFYMAIYTDGVMVDDSQLAS